MAFVIPAIASAIGGVGAAVGTAATGIGSMASLGTLLQGGTTALSLMQSLGAADQQDAAAATIDSSAEGLLGAAELVRMEGGLQQALAGLDASRYNVEAEGIKLDAELSGLDAERTALQLRKDLLASIGAQRVAFAASGVDPTSGTAMLVSEDLRKEVEADIGQVRKDAALGMKTKRMAAEMTRSGATAARIQGVLSSIATQGKLAGIDSQLSQIQSQSSTLRSDANSTRMGGVMSVMSFLGDALKRGA